MDKALKQKQKEEQVELEEKRKREIYLNGGYIDCITPKCTGQGIVSTNYLCKSCYEQEGRVRSPKPDTSPISCEGNSKFYASCEELDSSLNQLSFESSPMTVKLPPVSRSGEFSASTECRSPGCDFFGTNKFDGFCSKCYSNKKALI